jgi:gamma-glutamyltranspeptidase/glutathione hydrolase
MAPAIRLARNGYPLYEKMQKELERALRADRLLDSTTAEFARIFLVEGHTPPVGHVVRQPELAASLTMLASKGADSYYRGPFARKLVNGVRKLGGIWSEQDLADYRVVERAPLVTTYRGVRIVSAPPPSSGGVWLASVLNILAGYDLDGLDSATRKHLIVESMRRAHRDRAEYLGDPDFVKVPVAMLTDPDYAAGLRASIRADKATPSEMLPGYIGSAGSGGSQTTHFSVIDAEGNLVAASITLNGWFGTGIVVPGTGILLNNQMDDFAVKPGVPNIYGLVGAAANEVAPRKRPLSSMAPTFLEGERGLAILGSPGGSFIPSMVLLGALNWIAGADATAIVAAPRFHQQYQPDAIFAEPEAFSAEERSGLESRGHAMKPWPATIGNMQAITWDRATGRLVAASDPRGAGGSVVR